MIYCVPSTVMAGAVSCIIQNRFNRRRLSFNTMIYLSCPNTSRDLPVTGDPRGSCSPREISGTVFYLWLSKVSANERRRYICNVFSHWLRPCSTISLFHTPAGSAHRSVHGLCGFTKRRSDWLKCVRLWRANPIVTYPNKHGVYPAVANVTCVANVT